MEPRNGPPFGRRSASPAEAPKPLLTRARGTASAGARVFGLVWRTSPALTLGMAVVTLARSVQPAADIWVSKLLIDAVAAAVFAGTGNDAVPTILWLAGVQLGLLVAGSLLGALRNIVQQLLQERVSLDIQTQMMEQANRLDLAAFEDAAFYDRLQQVQREATFRPVAMVSELFNLVRMIVTFGTMIGLLLSLSWIIAVVALLAPIPTFIASTRYGWQGFQLMRRQSPMRRMMQYLTTVQTTDTFHKEVQIYGLGGYFLTEFRRLSREYFREMRGLVIRRYVAAFAWGALTVLSTAGTFVYVALEVVFGRLTIGDLTLFTRAASSVQDDFNGILGSFSALYEHGLYLSTLFDLLAMTPAITRPADPAPVRRPFREGIEFRNVTFHYPGRATPALQNVSFRIAIGETVAVVGPNGAGKTTLIKLLARLYDPTEGQVLIDGRDIREYDPDALRREVGALFQDFASFQLTARENIGLGQVDAIDNRPAIAHAATRAGADRVVDRLPNGFDTVLGKWFAGGQQLSGGEWQKIALARAFMRDAQILVLDEPTAALDAQAEFELFQRIRQLTAGRTAIFISHRFSTVRTADRILVIDNGRLVENGSHAELMAARGLYADLFDKQAASYR